MKKLLIIINISLIILMFQTSNTLTRHGHGDGAGIGAGIGIGLATGAIIGAAASSNKPDVVYVERPTETVIVENDENLVYEPVVEQYPYRRRTYHRPPSYRYHRYRR